MRGDRGVFVIACFAQFPYDHAVRVNFIRVPQALFLVRDPRAFISSTASRPRWQGDKLAITRRTRLAISDLRVWFLDRE